MTRKFRSFTLSIAIIALILAATAVLFTVQSDAASVQNATGQINAKGGAYLRESASTSSGKIRLLKDNTTVTIKSEIFTSKTSTSASTVWYSVVANGKSGYVRSDLVDNVKYTAVSGKVTSRLNYRVGPGNKMTLKGTYSAGTALTVYLKAKPVASTAGSSTFWYKTKVGGSYRYVASAFVDITGSIFENNTTDTDASDSAVNTDNSSQNNNSSNTDNNSSGNSSNSSDDFEAYLTSQGFPETYKTKLRALHAAHPNWVFIGKNTGVDWNTAVSKESANGVSLVESGQPLSYRATDSNSFKSSTTYIYKSTSTSSGSLGTLASFTNFTLLDEYWSGKTCWSHIRTSGGTTGYVQAQAYTQSYSECIKGTTTGSDLNVRGGGSTSNSVIGSLPNKGTEVSIVLQCKDSSGNIWYKIKYNSGYGYVSGSYVKQGSSASLTSLAEVPEEKETIIVTTLSDKYPSAKLSENKEYRAVADSAYPVLGSFDKDSEITIIAYVTDTDENKWYQAYHDGSIVYISSENMKITGDVEEASAEDPDLKPEDLTDEESGNVYAFVEGPSEVSGVMKSSANCRKSAGTNGEIYTVFETGAELIVTGCTKVDEDYWYAVNLDGDIYYVSAKWVEINLASAPTDAAPVVTEKEVEKETEAVTLAASSASQLNGTAQIASGSWIAKDGSTWFNANSQTVAYYMDPRNFLNEDRVYMFEDLSYQSAYQTLNVVSKVLSGSKLPGYGFTAQLFVNAGASYDISPVFLAARARQETGGGSIAISGYSYNGTVVYNPFNIGATSSSNPVMNGIKYAYNHGWTTKTKSVNGGASFLADGYINAGQNSIYFQRFNVANGQSKVATHQYMTNLQAPYNEAYTTKTSYAAYGITEESLTFIIPVFNNMPDSTSLPS